MILKYKSLLLLIKNNDHTPENKLKVNLEQQKFIELF